MKKVEKHIQLSKDLLRFLKDDLTLEEELQLKQILTEDKKLEEWWNQFRKADHIENRLKDYAQVDLNAKWNLHLAKRKSRFYKKRRTDWMTVAATVAVFVAVGWWAYQTGDSVEAGNAALSTIHPGSSKAELIVENGNHYILPELKPGVIREKGTAIAHSGKALTYAIAAASENKEKLKASMHTIVVPRGGKHQLTLSDGTKVWLNAQSKLRYPAWFDGDTRQVELSGEAYFAVAHDASKPFYVNARNTKVKVLGTEFNVKAYEDENEIAATLVKGKVHVQLNESAEHGFLRPGEQALVQGNNLSVNKVDSYYYTAWKEGVFVFKKERIQDIFRRLERWYDFDVFYSNESVKNDLFNGTIERTEEITDVLMLLERTKHIKFKIKGKTILVSEL